MVLLIALAFNWILSGCRGVRPSSVPLEGTWFQYWSWLKTVQVNGDRHGNQMPKVRYP